ncbi:MAG: XRE family transcriptional regulator [Ramlibacter sp.]|jgi:predicted XRE-type DNA-binding protein|nr:XRE family transcriptional regulator [Ramlibacter sp.]
MSSKTTNPQRFASVWDAIEDTPGVAAHMKARSELMMAIAEHVRKNGLTQAEAARLFGVTQPRVSDLVRGKIELFSIDTLVQMLASAGLRVEMKLRKAA